MSLSMRTALMLTSPALLPSTKLSSCIPTNASPNTPNSNCLNLWDLPNLRSRTIPPRPLSRGIDDRETITVVEGEVQNRMEPDKPDAPILAPTTATTTTGNKETDKKERAKPITTHVTTALKRGHATTAVKKGMKHVNAGNAFTMKNKNLKHHRQTTHNILP
jgi:hypothetical protein